MPDRIDQRCIAAGFMRGSNGVAFADAAFNRLYIWPYAHYRPWRMGLWIVMIGVVLVAITVYPPPSFFGAITVPVPE